MVLVSLPPKLPLSSTGTVIWYLDWRWTHFTTLFLLACSEHFQLNNKPFSVVALSIICKLLPRAALTKCLWPYCRERLDKQKLLPGGWNVPLPVLSFQAEAFCPNKNWTRCTCDPELVWNKTLQRWKTLHINSWFHSIYLQCLRLQRGPFKRTKINRGMVQAVDNGKQATSSHR